MTKIKEIVITGLGMITSLGNNDRECFKVLCEGKSGVKSLRAFDRTRYNTQYAYEIDDRDDGDQLYRASHWLTEAVQSAVDQADASDMSPCTQIPVFVGTGLRELRSLELSHTENKPMPPNALHFSSVLQSEIPCIGDVYTISNACASSNYALAQAEDMLQLGQSEIVIAAGCDSITESMFGLLDRVTAHPPDRIKVFDQDRKGVIMGDGASAVVVETLDHALKRGVKPLAKLLGVGLSCDAKHETAPDREGLMRCLSDAYQRANVTQKDIDVIYVHGTGTYLNDLEEAVVLKEMYKDCEKKPLLSTIKGMTGHTSGASGLVGVISAVHSIQSGQVPPCIELENPIDEIEGFFTYPKMKELANLNIAQVNAFGFGGVNSSVILKKSY